MWRVNQNLDNINLYILGKALNVSEAWLMGYDVPMQAEQIAPSNTYPLDDITVC